MREIKRVVEVKEGRNWNIHHEVTDEKEIYESLAHDLIAKKLSSCTWIKSIKRVQNYDGTITITVNYDNNCRSLYTVKDH